MIIISLILKYQLEVSCPQQHLTTFNICWVSTRLTLQLPKTTIYFSSSLSHCAQLHIIKSGVISHFFCHCLPPPPPLCELELTRCARFMNCRWLMNLHHFLCPNLQSVLGEWISEWVRSFSTQCKFNCTYFPQEWWIGAREPFAEKMLAAVIKTKNQTKKT